MQDDAIRAALDAAWRAECIARANMNDCAPAACTTPCRWCSAGSTAAIAAFHMRLKSTHSIVSVGIITNDELAAAVERAAQEDRT